MTILSVAQDFALSVGLDRPVAVYGDPDRTAEELRALARDAAERIIQDRDWLALSRSLRIVGDGITTVFPLPADFDRFRMGAELYSGATGQAISRLSSPQQAIYAGASPIAPHMPRWRIAGRTVVVEPASGDVLQGAYQSNWYAVADDGTAKPTFTVDSDSFALPERLLRLAMVWMWKSQKGLPYGQDYDSFETAAGEAFGREGDRTPLVIGPVRTVTGVVQPFFGSITPLPLVPVDPDSPDPGPGPGPGPGPDPVPPVWDDNATWSD